MSRVSVTTAGTQANGASFDAQISGDGKAVVFSSAASNLVAGDTNAADDVFLRDLRTDSTALVSAAINGGVGNAASGSPSLSSAGRYVAFASEASNLVADDTNGVADIFVRDMTTGVTERVSLDGSGNQSAFASRAPQISADGSRVVFSSQAEVQGYTVAAVFVWTRESGVASRLRPPVPADCLDLGGVVDDATSDAAISGNGRYVAFGSECGYATPLGYQRLVEVDLQRHLWTEIDSIGFGGDSPPFYAGLAYSADGNTLVWEHRYPGGHGGFPSGYLDYRDRVDRYPSPGGPALPSQSLGEPDVSADGRYLTWNFPYGRGPLNQDFGQDVVVLDRATGETRLASATDRRSPAHGWATGPSIDDAGDVVAFTSDADDVVGGDTNGTADVFTADRAQLPTVPNRPAYVPRYQYAEPANGTTSTVTVPVEVMDPSVTSISWHTSDGTAQAPSDYLAVTSGNAPVTWDPYGFGGYGEAQLSITLRGDATPEGVEYLTINIDGPTGVVGVGPRRVEINAN